MIDDHSRLCVASRAMNVVKRPPTWSGSCTKRPRPGGIRPRFSLTTGSSSPPAPPQVAGRRLEQELFALGHRGQALAALPSPDLRQGRALPPDHEEVLGRPGSAPNQKQLQRQLDRFVAYYNRGAPAPGHRAPHPSSVYEPGRRPARARTIEVAGRRTALRQGGQGRPVTLRHKGSCTTSASVVPMRAGGWSMLIDGLDIRGRRRRRLAAAAPGPRPDQGLPAHALRQ